MIILKKYAVLYMHDGQMLFDSTINWNHQEWGVDETVAEAGARGQNARLHRGRHLEQRPDAPPEYFPQKPFDALYRRRTKTP